MYSHHAPHTATVVHSDLEDSARKAEIANFNFNSADTLSNALRKASLIHEYHLSLYNCNFNTLTPKQINLAVETACIHKTVLTLAISNFYQISYINLITLVSALNEHHYRHSFDFSNFDYTHAKIDHIHKLNIIIGLQGNFNLSFKNSNLNMKSEGAFIYLCRILANRSYHSLNLSNVHLNEWPERRIIVFLKMLSSCKIESLALSDNSIELSPAENIKSLKHYAPKKLCERLDLSNNQLASLTAENIQYLTNFLKYTQSINLGCNDLGRWNNLQIIAFSNILKIPFNSLNCPWALINSHSGTQNKSYYLARGSVH